MITNQFLLLREKRLGPLMVSQCLGAFVDNLYKTLLVVALAYGLWDTGSFSPQMVVTMAAGVFILPFALFAPLGGDLADKLDKARLIRAIKLGELVITAAAITALLLGHTGLLMIVLFALGVQSALFAPTKLAILPQHLSADELIAGNALMNTGTYLAILLGTILGSLWAITEAGQTLGLITLGACSVAGYLASRSIPSAPAPVPDLHIGWNVLREAYNIVRGTRRHEHSIFAAILGVGWFYYIGGTFLAQFPNFTKQVLGADTQVLTVFMVLFSVGIGLGGLVNNRLLKGHVDPRFTPWAALAIAVVAIDLYLGIFFWEKPVSGLVGLGEFFSTLSGWWIALDLLALAVAGGIYVVPLNAYIQSHAPPERRARIIASSTLINALFILASSLVAMALFTAGLGVDDLFVITGLASIPWAAYLWRVLLDRSFKL